MATEQISQPGNEEAAKAKLGDVVTIDFKGMINGVAFQGGTGSDFNLELGSGQFIPGFEAQLVGAKTGEERMVNVTFPKQYPSAEVAGQTASFLVKVKGIQHKDAPEVDDKVSKTGAYDELLRARQAADEKTNAMFGQVDQIIKTELIPTQKSLTNHNRMYAAAVVVGGIAAGALAAFLTFGTMSILPQLAIIGASAIGGLVAGHLPMRNVVKQAAEESRKIAQVKSIAAALFNEAQQERELAKNYTEQLAAGLANGGSEPAAGFASKISRRPNIADMAALDKVNASDINAAGAGRAR